MSSRAKNRESAVINVWHLKTLDQKEKTSGNGCKKHEWSNNHHAASQSKYQNDF